MFDRHFFQSKLGFFKTKLGHAALLSTAAMLAMNIVALNSQLYALPVAYAAAPYAVELA